MELKATSERVAWIDIAKGILILFVIWGHSVASSKVHNYRGSFYMPAFFVLSGYTMREKLDLPWRTYIANKAVTLLGPYLLFSLAWIVYSYIKTLIEPTGFSAETAVISIFLPYSGRTDGSVYNFWFLPCLFLANFAVSLMVYLCGWKKLFGLVLALLYGLLGSILEHGSLLSGSAMAIVFVTLGYLARKYRLGTISAVVGVVCLILHSIGVLVNVGYLENTLDYSAASFGNPFLFILGGVAGTVAWCKIAQIWKSAAPLQFVGKNSLTYYGIHYFLVSTVGFFSDNALIVMVGTLVGTTIVTLIYNKIGINKLFVGRYRT